MWKLTGVHVALAVFRNRLGQTVSMMAVGRLATEGYLLLPRETAQRHIYSNGCAFC